MCKEPPSFIKTLVIHKKYPLVIITMGDCERSSQKLSLGHARQGLTLVAHKSSVGQRLGEFAG
jgi:hypothetical protein